MASNTFDGAAISKADREFLQSLDDHVLPRHPLYGVPCPPQPNLGDPLLDTAAMAAERREAYDKAIEWLLVNYAYCKNAFGGKGGIVSLVSGEVITMACLREYMAPWTYYEVGPQGGTKKYLAADGWKAKNERAEVLRIEMRPEQRRPTFDEDGGMIFNKYRPPKHPTTGDELKAFEDFLTRLLPDESERTWFWHWLSHKARRPWVPMVGVIMVAEQFGTGRGTLFNILELLFGKDYVVPCNFAELTGTSQAARFNARLAEALIAVVDEAVAEDGQQQTVRRLQYEALKNTIEPSPTARLRFEAKWQHAFAQQSSRSTIIATNHRDIIKLPADDRRLSVLTCGRKMTADETAAIRSWMARPENIGALYRALLTTPATPLEVFDPFGEPPPFAGRQAMIAMGRSELEDAYGAAISALDGYPLFTLTQAQKLVGHFTPGVDAGGSDTAKIRHTIAKRAYRLRERDQADNRIRYRKRQEIIYARTQADQRKWRDADIPMILVQLDRTEAWITRIMNAEEDVLANFVRSQSTPGGKG